MGMPADLHFEKNYLPAVCHITRFKQNAEFITQCLLFIYIINFMRDAWVVSAYFPVFLCMGIITPVC